MGRGNITCITHTEATDEYTFTISNSSSCFKYTFQIELPSGAVNISADCEGSFLPILAGVSADIPTAVDVHTKGTICITLPVSCTLEKKNNCHNSWRFMDGFTSSRMINSAFCCVRYNSNLHRRTKRKSWRYSQRFVAPWRVIALSNSDAEQAKASRTKIPCRVCSFEISQSDVSDECPIVSNISGYARR